MKRALLVIVLLLLVRLPAAAQSVVINPAPVPACTTGQTLVYSGSTWTCGSVGTGTVTGSGTTGTIPRWSSSSALTDSTLTEASGIVTATGGFTVNGAFTIPGSTSGTLRIKPAAIAGSGSVFTFPAGTTDMSATGGSGYALLQDSTGAAITVGLITKTGTLTAGATGSGFTVALSTSTITGTLADARLSANVPLLDAANVFSHTTGQRVVALGIGAAPSSSTGTTFNLGGNITLASGGYSVTEIAPNVTVPSGSTGYMAQQAGSMTSAASSTHAKIAYLQFSPAFTNGGATVTNAAVIDISAWSMHTNVTNAAAIRMQAPDTVTNSYFATFINASGSIQGSITATNSTTTAFNTSSDSRMKDDKGVVTSTTVLKDLLVHDFDWKINRIRDRGLFAQEAIKVKPSAVNRPKGKDELVLDEKSGLMVPVTPWGIDYSKFVPDLIVGWQMHDRQIADLLARIKVLEGKK